MKQIEGIAAAPGIAMGPVFQFRQVDLQVRRYMIDHPDEEILRLENALKIASDQVQAVYEKAKERTAEGQASVFEAHLMILQDPDLLGKIRESITNKKLNAESSVRDATEFYARTLEGMKNEYFRSRATDVRDIAGRLVRILSGVNGANLDGLVEPSIVIARELTPSDTILLDQQLVLGFCTVAGSETSHTAILARGLGIPAVVGSGLKILDIPNGQEVILDGTEGKLYPDLTKELKDSYRNRKISIAAKTEKAVADCQKPAITLDNHRVEVVANIGNVTDAQAALQKGAEGVGLLRTEFLYMERGELPGEEEQYQAYKAIFDVFGNLPVVLRTSDIGGDKALPYLNLEKEANPFLGVRGLRLALLHSQELFKPQLRAALRAGVGHDLRIMFPMVAVLEEIHQARTILEECKNELAREGKSLPATIQVGIMVEVPSAALMADKLAPSVDFFSIGTNDLTQYTLAVDRTNPNLAYLTSAFSPAVLRLIQNVITQAHRHQKWVGLCGELAGEPLAIPILLGLGLDEFSMNPSAIPTAKQVIRGLKVPECQQLAGDVLDYESASQVRACVKDRFPSIMSA